MFLQLKFLIMVESKHILANALVLYQQMCQLRLPVDKVVSHLNVKESKAIRFTAIFVH